MPPADPAVRASTIAGRGLFGNDALAAGTVAVTFDHDVVTAVDFGALNHSCDPNLGWASARDLVTLRAIAAGEELTVDYSTAIDDPDFVLYCHCGSTRCRQAVEGTDWRIPQLRVRYSGRWVPHIQARINADTVVP